MMLTNRYRRDKTTVLSDKTIVMIAHRLKTVRGADQIVVLSGGHIVGQGIHEDFVGKDGLYKEFLHARKNAISWKVG